MRRTKGANRASSSADGGDMAARNMSYTNLAAMASAF